MEADGNKGVCAVVRELIPDADLQQCRMHWI